MNYTIYNNSVFLNLINYHVWKPGNPNAAVKIAFPHISIALRIFGYCGQAIFYFFN